MSVWREVQETLLQRWTDGWVNGGNPLTPFWFQDEKAEPPNGQWARVRIDARPGTQETLGRPGNRKIARRGAVYAMLRQPPDGASGALSDLGEFARDLFENCRLAPHDIRFTTVQIGPMLDVDDEGRWSGVTVEAPFDYEQLK